MLNVDGTYSSTCSATGLSLQRTGADHQTYAPGPEVLGLRDEHEVGVMGLLDRWFKAKQTVTPPAPSPPTTSPPSLPARAKIDSYVVADAVGVLTLANGG